MPSYAKVRAAVIGTVTLNGTNLMPIKGFQLS